MALSTEPLTPQDYLEMVKNYLDAKDSDPTKMGWMKGFPPEKDRVVTAIDGSFFVFPALRYSVCHMRNFFPTTVVQSAQTNRYKFRNCSERWYTRGGIWL